MRCVCAACTSSHGAATIDGGDSRQQQQHRRKISLIRRTIWQFGRSGDNAAVCLELEANELDEFA